MSRSWITHTLPACAKRDTLLVAAAQLLICQTVKARHALSFMCVCLRGRLLQRHWQLCAALQTALSAIGPS